MRGARLAKAIGLLWSGCAIALTGMPPTSGGEEASIRNPCSGSVDVVADGKRLYLLNGCYACHGIDATGKIGPDLTKTSKTEEEMFYRITNGKEGTTMGPFRDKIAPDEIRRIIVYLRSLARQ